MTPSNLAAAVQRELNRRKHTSPPLPTLVNLFETMYYATLKTEEGHSVAFHVVFLDPDHPDPEPPVRIVKDRWSFVRFAAHIPFNLPDLVKLATASDPRTSSLAVYYDSGGQLFVWGLVDQGNRYYDFVNFDDDAGPERPGLFQANTSGLGRLTASISYETIAELNVSSLVTHSADVLRKGPVREALGNAIEQHVVDVGNRLAKAAPQLQGERYWEPWLRDDWIACLCRLLLRIRNYHHGGAVLLTPDASHEGLDIKFPIRYPRLRTSLIGLGYAKVLENYYWSEIAEGLNDDDYAIPTDLYLNEAVHDNESDEHRHELDGSIWFVSLLSRVDGLVLLSQDLEVQGFGVEITESDVPGRIALASGPLGTRSSLKALDYYRWGTRHRSMMRYCAKVPRSVGFVVSQDGDVRVMTHLNDQLVVWDNVRLQLQDFVRRPTKRGRVGAKSGPEGQSETTTLTDGTAGNTHSEGVL